MFLSWIKSAFSWVKKNAVLIAVAIGGVIAMLFAVSHEKSKIRGIELTKEMEKLQSDKKNIEAVRKLYIEDIKKDSIEVKIIKEEIDKIDKKIERVKNEVKQLEPSEVVNRFNSLYG